MTDPQEPNSELQEKLSGDQTGRELAAHYRKAYPRLTTVAAAVLGRQEGAEDIVQQAAEIAVAKGKQFATASAFLAWMVGVVRRCALNQRRKTLRRRTHTVGPEYISAVIDPHSSMPVPIDTASGELLDNQTSFEDHLLQALEELTDEARCCLLLRTVQNLSYAEIADLLGIPAGTAMSHVHRSRQQLRRRLAKSDDARESKPSPRA